MNIGVLLKENIFSVVVKQLLMNPHFQLRMPPLVPLTFKVGS